MVAEAHIQAIARFVVGYGTEEGHVWCDYHLDFAGTIDYDSKTGVPLSFKPVGKSGYSLGCLQWDFGQRPALAAPLVENYVAWAANNPSEPALKNDGEFVIRALSMDGKKLAANHKLGLNRQDVVALSKFVLSEDGSNWVNDKIDVLLIGSDAQRHAKVGKIDYGYSCFGAARELETTPTYMDFAKNPAIGSTDLLYAVAMKANNQLGSGGFRKYLMPFLKTSRTEEEVRKWPRATGGIKDGIILTDYWSKIRSDYLKTHPLIGDMDAEMERSPLANSITFSPSSGAYVISKLAFEHADRFKALMKAVSKGVDYIDKKLFDAKGNVAISSKTSRYVPGMICKKKVIFLWDAAGNAFSYNGSKFAPIKITSIHP